MAEFQPTTTSPLSGMSAAFGGIDLIERPFSSKINLRGDADDPGVKTGMENVLGCSLPLEPNTVSGTDDLRVFWLGPNEWLVHCNPDLGGGLIEDLRSSLSGHHAAVTDVSDYYVVIGVQGEKALEVLSKSIPLDLHPRAFDVGGCAQTHAQHATVLLHKISAVEVDVQVRWSFAEYLWNLLRDGTREYARSPSS